MSPQECTGTAAIHEIEHQAQQAFVQLDELGVHAGNVDLTHEDAGAWVANEPLDDVEQQRPCVGDGEHIVRATSSSGIMVGNRAAV